MERKYRSWGEFLKKNRNAKFRSAREFCLQKQVGISYPQYSRYEAGDQLPALDQALELCRLLDVPLLEGLLEWCRSQIRDECVGKEVEQLLGRVRSKDSGNAAVLRTGNASQEGSKILAHGAVPLDDVIVFNRSHLKIFHSDPHYRDIFTYVNSYAPEWVSIEELAKALSVPKAKMEKMIEKLSDLGVILTAGGKCRASKRNFYFPDDQDFFQLRNQNFEHNTGAILSRLKYDELIQRKAYRNVVTRELTSEQMERLASELDELMGRVVSLPEDKAAEKIFSACVLVGERFSRPGIA